MKPNLHPVYHQATVTCACGNSFVVGSTIESYKVEICSNCHPFYTGKAKYIDTAGRMDKFAARLAKQAEITSAAATKKPRKSNKKEE